MIRTARITLKVHRYEALAALALGVGLGVWAASFWYRLMALNVPFRCIDGWLINGPETRPDCGGLMHQWATIASAEAEPFFAAIGVIPFVIGLVAGSPIVARELEAGTAQTSWWLNPSRSSWLLRQLGAIGIPLLLVMAFVAVASDLFAAQDVAWGVPASYRIGLHGPVVMARTAAAFGLALLAGTWTGRSLPAFIGGAVLIAVFAISISFAHGVWTSSLPTSVVGVQSPVNGEMVLSPGSVATGWAWRAPDGTISTQELEGYEPVMVGISDAAAVGWEPIETAAYSIAGGAALLLTLVAIRRRRPI